MQTIITKMFTGFVLGTAFVMVGSTMSLAVMPNTASAEEFECCGGLDSYGFDGLSFGYNSLDSFAPSGLESFSGNGLDAFGYNGLDSLGFNGLDAFGSNGLDALGFNSLDAFGYNGLDSLGYNGLDAFGSNGLDALGFNGLDAFGYNGLDSFGYNGLDAFGYDGLDSLGFNGLDGFGYNGLDAFGSNELDALGFNGLDSYGFNGLDSFASNNLDTFGYNGLDSYGQEYGGVATFEPLGGTATYEPLGGTATYEPLGGTATYEPIGNGYSTSQPVYGQGGYTVSTPVYRSGSTAGYSYSTGGGRTTVTSVPSRPITYTVSTPQPPVYYPPYNPPQYPPYNPPTPPRPTPTCVISANPTTVNQNGATTLSWNAQNATSASLSGFGSVSTNGSRQVTGITGTRVYTLSVNGQGGSSSCSVTIYVQQQNPSCTLVASPSSVQQGGSTTLNWNTQNAVSATLTDAGAVSLSGSRVFGNLQSTRNFTLTVRSATGATNTCTASVGVYSTPVPPHPTVVPTCTISASQTSVGYGQYTTLNWSSYNASSANITNIGAVSTNGTRAVMPNGTVTYTMTVFGQGGSNSCSTTVYAQTQPPYYPPVVPPTYPPVSGLYCTITANPTAIRNGQSALLSWTSYGAASASLNDGLGPVRTSGSLSVRPESSRYYTLTIRDYAGRVQTCSTNLTVSGASPYVSLSAVPYTGLDLGIMGNILYWGALLAWAVGAAYLIVGYKGGIFGAVYKIAGMHATPRKMNPDAVILSEVITAKVPEVARATAQATRDTRNEDVVASAIERKAATTDTMTLEGDGSMPRIVIRRV